MPVADALRHPHFFAKKAVSRAIAHESARKIDRFSHILSNYLTI
jgi:hypothetical protein